MRRSGKSMNKGRFRLAKKGFLLRRGDPGKSWEKRLCLFAAGAVCLLLGACGAPREAGAGTAPDGRPRLQVTATIFPPCDFARQIGGDYVEVYQLLKPGMEAHSYEPSPRDIVRVMESDLFLYAGGESDVWVEEILSGLEGETTACSLLEWVEPLEEETRVGMQVRGDHPGHGGEEAHEGEDSHAPHGREDFYASHEEKESRASREGEDFHTAHEGVRLDGEYDEHVWTAPANAVLLVERIRDEMIALDPSRAKIYGENAEKYLQSLRELEEEYAAVAENAHRKTLLFADRFPFLYLVRSYGLEYYAAFPGCSPETEPSAATIAFLTDRVREEGIPMILYLESSDGRIARAIGEATDTEIGILHSCHTLTREEEEAKETYLSLMRKNLAVLDKALNG